MGDRDPINAAFGQAPCTRCQLRDAAIGSCAQAAFTLRSLRLKLEAAGHLHIQPLNTRNDKYHDIVTVTAWTGPINAIKPNAGPSRRRHPILHGGLALNAFYKSPAVHLITMLEHYKRGEVWACVTPDVMRQM